MNYTNISGINLMLAVWLMHDSYDYIDMPNYISATSLMKPLRQLVLTSRIPPQERTEDIQDRIARAYGHAIHDSIEKAWTHGYEGAMRKLGFPQKVIDQILINPTPEELAAKPDAIPVYLEQRGFREIEVDGVTFTIGGKFDMVADGQLADNKSTSAYSWLFGTRDEDHREQGSIYRWIHPDKITSDTIKINYIFTDWSRAQARVNPKYPQKRVEEKTIPLRSMEETEDWIRSRLRKYLQYKDRPEHEIPHCTDAELWRSDPQYKYYSDPDKISGRSTKNFSDKAEADLFCASKGKGVVITVPGEPKACSYCTAFDACTQKDGFF